MREQDIFVEHGKAGKPLKDVFIMDAHCHLGPSRRLRELDSSTESIIRVMDLLGVDIAVLSSILAIDGVIKQGNDQVIAAVRCYPGRIFGYTCVNPRYRDAAAGELQRCLEAGLRGIKVSYTLGTTYNHPCYDLVWEFAARHDLPVLAHTGGKDIEEIEPCFTRYPSVTWIMAHGGIADREVYARVGKQYSNVYVDTVYSACPRGMIEYFVASGLEDKLLWGTDMPWESAQPQFGKVLFARITPAQKAKILGENAKRVLGRAIGWKN